jgi:hypothetical protein
MTEYEKEWMDVRVQLRNPTRFTEQQVEAALEHAKTCITCQDWAVKRLSVYSYDELDGYIRRQLKDKKGEK